MCWKASRYASARAAGRSLRRCASIPASGPAFFKNVTIGGGPAPVRAYIDELLPDILDGRIEPGRATTRKLVPRSADGEAA